MTVAQACLPPLRRPQNVAELPNFPVGKKRVVLFTSDIVLTNQDRDFFISTPLYGKRLFGLKFPPTKKKSVAVGLEPGTFMPVRFVLKGRC